MIEETDPTVEEGPRSNDPTEKPSLPSMNSECNSLNSTPPLNGKIEKPPRRSKLQVTAILSALYLSVFIAALDQTITATAIPTITSHFESSTGYTWVGGAYLLSKASATPIWVRLSDIWGRKPLFLASIALFHVSSIICALARSMTMLIVGRAIQGAAGGAVFQFTTVIISDIFSTRTRSLFIGLTELMWAIAGGLGPLLGGFLAEHVSWRYIFWINLPISGISLLLTMAFLDLHNPKTDIIKGLKMVDWYGSATMLAMTLMILVGLDLGSQVLPWDSPAIVCLFVFGSLTFLLFLWSEKRAEYPVISLEIFRDMSNVASLVVNFTQAFVYMAAEYYLPLYFQSAKQALPTRSGLLILPLTLVQALAVITSGALIHRTGEYCFIIYIGMALATMGNGIYTTFQPETTIATIIGIEVITGIGIGLTFEPPLIAIHAITPQDSIASATSTFGYIHNLATAMATVIGNVLFHAGIETGVSHLEAAGLPSHLIVAFKGNKAFANVELIADVADPVQRAALKELYTRGLRKIWILCAGLCGLGLLASALIKRRALSEEPVETKTGISKDVATVTVAKLEDD